MKRYFFAAAFLTFIATGWFAHHTIHTTLPHQILNRYTPGADSTVVFLGSSLTAAAINSPLLDSLLTIRHAGLQSVNLALAELATDAYFYLIIKNWILPRAQPAVIIIEERLFPFVEKKHEFRLAGRGIAADLTLTELMSYNDYCRLSGGFPGLINSLSFFLHKRCFLYHHRLTIQEKIAERFSRAKERVALSNRFRMNSNGPEKIAQWARRQLTDEKKSGSEGLLSDNRYFKDIAELAAENNLKIIFLWPPFPPADSILKREPVYKKRIAEFKATCASRGIACWDFSTLPENQSWNYDDGVHLDNASARLFTRMVADSLATWLDRAP